MSSSDQVRQTLQQFQDGYTTRDLSKLDEFMQLFVQGDEPELIGIGASVRGGNEWFQGDKLIRDIVESDWTYWGNVVLDVAGAKITVQGDVAWLSTTGDVVQTTVLDKALPSYLSQMKELIENESQPPQARLMEATHFGMRRLREIQKGEGHRWPFVFTAVLVQSKGQWRFHTIHWAMPVD